MFTSRLLHFRQGIKTTSAVRIRRQFSDGQSVNQTLTLITDAIASNKVVIFSKTYCGYSYRTKQLFEDMNVPVLVMELDQMENGDEIQKTLADFTGQRTVPNVFICGKHLGGNDDTHRAKDSGELEKLLRGA
mmetsp:Transcript_21474/g.31146  ORF Transcript_21474/g.31146 Transcript_21474/m.31146 type:complete len:132 (-) Transcript_21474:167-562(-)